jgi:hypothetical protein
MKAIVLGTGCLILLIFWVGPMTMSQSAEVKAPLLAATDKPESSKAIPQAASEKRRQQQRERLFRINELLDTGQDRQATEEWEQFLASKPRVNTWERLAWKLAQAYMKERKYDKAVDVYKPHYPIVTESIKQRAELGETLIFGEAGASPTKEGTPLGKGQCTVCHYFFEEQGVSTRAPNLYGLAKRARELIGRPEYVLRRKDTVQPEAFPGSGIAINVIEYLAESKVCPSCYIPPNGAWKESHGRESREPALHTPPISLTINEMIAIDTWLLKQEGEEVPPLEVMQAAYEKFLRPEDRPGSYEGLLLASLYDAKGEIQQAILLVDQNYAGVVRYEPARSKEGQQLAKWRVDPGMFMSLKKRPDIVARFPHLLKAAE